MPLYRQIDRRALQLWPVEFLRDVPLQLGPHAAALLGAAPAQLPGTGAMIYLIDAPALFDRDCALRQLRRTNTCASCC